MIDPDYTTDFWFKLVPDLNVRALLYKYTPISKLDDEYDNLGSCMFWQVYRERRPDHGKEYWNKVYHFYKNHPVKTKKS